MARTQPTRVIPKSKIIDLATCGFVARKENVLLVGRAGVGKSHIAQALGQCACRAGYDVIYVSAHDMLTQLRSVRADATHDRKMLRFTTPGGHPCSVTCCWRAPHSTAFSITLT